MPSSIVLLKHEHWINKVHIQKGHISSKHSPLAVHYPRFWAHVWWLAYTVNLIKPPITWEESQWGVPGVTLEWFIRLSLGDCLNEVNWCEKTWPCGWHCFLGRGPDLCKVEKSGWVQTSNGVKHSFLCSWLWVWYVRICFKFLTMMN